MGAARADRPEMEWTVHPFKEEPKPKTGLLCILIVASSIGAGVGFEGAAYGLIALVFLCGSMSRYFLPTRYCVDRTGVQVVHLGRGRRYRWADLRRADLHRDGVFLSSSARPSRLDSFRGCFIRWSAHRDELLRFVDRHVQAAAS